MPPLSRDKGRPRSRRSDDEFVVFLQGIPPHCRWQELKDLVRQTALHIRQAVVYDDSHGFPTGLGQIIVKNEDEAWRTYRRSTFNQRMGRPKSGRHTLANKYAHQAHCRAYQKSINGTYRLHRWSLHTSISTWKHGNAPVTRLARILPSANSTISIPRVRHHDGTNANATAIIHAHDARSTRTTNAVFPPSPVMNGAMYEPHWNMMPGYQMSPPQHMHYPNSDNQPHNHHREFCKGPNPNSPSFYPNRRAITIENLDATTTCTDLKTLLQTAGTVQKCNIATANLADGSVQLRGLITMQTAEEAQCAVTMFNNLSFMGSRIRVKIDRDSHITRAVSCERVLGAGVDAGSDTAGSVPGNRDMCQSWADEIAAEANVVDVCKPLVIDGSGLNRSVDILSMSAPT
ncbi:Nucleotide-binding alpha-beta plait [Penicillium fimorum]|uniref:Nucleotide-binding alpha-beta plait n=1 Tax=Penicillium fimorum TaxID=1882269 RepID=A0A9W9XT57_9EURO|nr:Nucleotide-binding alpha-beta plait [Penicillium fimorum]